MSVSRFVGSETQIQTYPCIIPLARELSIFVLPFFKIQPRENQQEYLFFFFLSVCIYLNSFLINVPAGYKFFFNMSGNIHAFSRYQFLQQKIIHANSSDEIKPKCMTEIRIYLSVIKNACWHKNYNTY